MIKVICDLTVYFLALKLAKYNTDRYCIKGLLENVVTSCLGRKLNLSPRIPASTNYMENLDMYLLRYEWGELIIIFNHLQMIEK